MFRLSGLTVIFRSTPAGTTIGLLSKSSNKIKNFKSVSDRFFAGLLVIVYYMMSFGKRGLAIFPPPPPKKKSTFFSPFTSAIDQKFTVMIKLLNKALFDCVPKREGVWADRSDHDGRDGGVNHAGASRHGVGRTSGRGRDDQTISLKQKNVLTFQANISDKRGGE